MGILKHLVIAVTGTLEYESPQLKKWIEANNGRYSPSVHHGITHLIAGRDAWKNASDAVQAAIKLGAFVVVYDWLEDSLQRGRKLAESKYTWEYKWQERRRNKDIKRLGLLADTKKFNDGCEEAKKATGTGMSKLRPRTVIHKPKQSKSFFFGDVVNVPFISAADDLKRKREEREAAKFKKAEEEAAKKIKQAEADRATSVAPSAAQSFTSNSSPTSPSSHALNQSVPLVVGAQAKKPSLKDLYHYYLDTTGFEYKITLTRCNLRANEITRCRLSILESHAKPPVYCTFIEYFPPGTGTSIKSGDACIQSLLDFNSTFREDAAPVVGNDTSEHERDNSPRAHLTFPQQGIQNHPEATRLHAVLATPTPSATMPYKSLIAPMNSTFATAWRAFRHAFRDLTLLSWEERFDITKTLYKARAQHLAIEPFMYMRPKPGLPLGLRVQSSGLFQAPTLPSREETCAIVIVNSPSQAAQTSDDDGYIYNAFSLPALSSPLGPGIIGTAIRHDADIARKAAEKAPQHADGTEEGRIRVSRLARKQEGRADQTRPLFNGVTGRPTTDVWGRLKRSGRGVGRSRSKGGEVKKNYGRPFPSEREL